jgi:hypothetical protein
VDAMYKRYITKSTTRIFSISYIKHIISFWIDDTSLVERSFDWNFAYVGIRWDDVGSIRMGKIKRHNWEEGCLLVHSHDCRQLFLKIPGYYEELFAGLFGGGAAFSPNYAGIFTCVIIRCVIYHAIF